MEETEISMVFFVRNTSNAHVNEYVTWIALLRGSYKQLSEFEIRLNSFPLTKKN